MKPETALRRLSALAQQSRLQTFRLLVKRGPEGFTPTDLAKRLKLPAPTLSFHLKELQRTGLVDVHRNGRSLNYRANFDNMNQLIDFLTANCCALAERELHTECQPPESARRGRR